MNKSLRFIIISVIGSILMSYIALRIVYGGKNDVPFEEENLILNKYAAQVSGIRLSSYPAESSIIWYKKEKHDKDLSLRLSIIEHKNRKARYYYNINFLRSLNLSLYKDTGNLEFWLKGGKNYLFIESLDICLKDKDDTCLVYPFSKFIGLNAKWQNVSLPLSVFTREKGVRWNGKRWVSEYFDWNNVGGIIYVLVSKKGLSPIEIFVDTLKIVDYSEIIYNVFDNFE